MDETITVTCSASRAKERMEGGRCPCPLVDMTGSSMKGGRPTPTVVLLPIQLQTTSPKCQNPDARARREKLQLPGRAGRLRTGQANAGHAGVAFLLRLPTQTTYVAHRYRDDRGSSTSSDANGNRGPGYCFRDFTMFLDK